MRDMMMNIMTITACWWKEDKGEGAREEKTFEQRKEGYPDRQGQARG